MDILPKSDITIGPWTTAFLLGFTTLLLFLWYTSRKHSYWKNKGIVYVAPIPLLGSLWDSLTKPYHETELKRYKKYGRIYGHYEVNRPLLSVGDPDILRNIFVKDFQAFTGRRKLNTSGTNLTDKMVSILRGEDWKRVRTVLTPTFTTGKIKRMMSIFKECAQTLVKNFKEAADKGENIDAKRLFGAFTMDVIASSAFSTKIDSHNDPNNKFVQAARDVFFRKFNWRFLLIFLAPYLFKLFRISIFPTNGVNFFKTVTLQIIEERKRTGQTRNDFLQLLMDAAKEASEGGMLNREETENEDIIQNYGKDESQQMFKNAYAKKSLSHDELVAQCVLFFLAGYETTASTMAFASYLLALNPECQEKLIQEIDEVLENNKGEMTYEAVQSIKYLDNVISETLRFYPPLVRLEREADEDYKIENIGITIEKGMIISIPVYAMHRDPEFFPDPEKFNPDRFNSEERKNRNQYVYLPFGSGPRNCVGMRFAIMEIKVCLASVFSQFRIKKCSETKVPLEFRIGNALMQPKEIKLKLEIRKDAVNVL